MNKAGDTLKDLHFPKAGLDVSRAFMKQPNRPVGDGNQWARTTPLGMNVRGFSTDQRKRGGARSGLSRWLDRRVAGAHFIVQDLNLLVGVGYNPPGGGTVQTSSSGRVVSLVAVSQGNIFVANPGDTAWTQADNQTGETPPLNYTGLIFSTACNQDLFFADGVNDVYYDPATNTAFQWTATAGELPIDDDDNTARLICTWRGRVVLSGVLEDQQNWFMSSVGDPTDWDYSPTSISATQAVAGNNSPMGLIGDMITSLVPYSDDVLIFGGDHTIYMMRGDPMAGGQIDRISETIGFSWGMPWCQDPYGAVYFFSNLCGVYRFVPGQPFGERNRISQAIESKLEAINTGTNIVRMIWDDRYQGFHMFVSPTSAPGAPEDTTHFFYEQRTNAWFTDRFANADFNPLCCVTFDGNRPDDRRALIGSWDGYVRVIDPDADQDDTEDIESVVVIGPLLTPNFDDVLLKDIQAVLAEDSGDVTYAIYVSDTAEQAVLDMEYDDDIDAGLRSGPYRRVVMGTWTAGRNLTNLVRRAGHAVFLKLTASGPWAMEAIRARLAPTGKVRMRGA